jgi:exopolysaccharide biosynthesis polyprenyl glycosylphosphotransferase
MAVSLLCLESALFFAIFSLVLYPVEATGGGFLSRFHAPVTAMMLSGCCIGALYYAELYDRHSLHRLSTCLMRAVRAAAVTALPLLVLVVILMPAGMAWARIAAGLVVAGLLVVVNRAAWQQVVFLRSPVEQVMVLGKTPLARAVIAELQVRPEYRLLDDDSHQWSRSQKVGVPLLVAQERRKRGRSARPDRIVVALNERRGRMPVDALLDAKRQGIPVEDAMSLYERLTGKLAIEALHPSQVFFASEFNRDTVYDRVARGVSLAAAALGLLVCGPVMGAIALLVKLDSRGPVLFVQERIGRDGARFSLMKFRTLCPAEDRRSEWVKDNGDRITRIGRWLRKFRLDELPQLFNVLVGHMNLIGPRPHPATNYDLFTEHIPFYAFRSLVRPGITGWAQVRYGYANNLKEETEKMRYDLYYIKHRSVRLDVDIMLRTMKVVLLGSDTKLDGADPPSDRLLEERIDAA